MKRFICFALALFVLLCGAMPSFAVSVETGLPSETPNPSSDYTDLGSPFSDVTLSYLNSFHGTRSFSGVPGLGSVSFEYYWANDWNSDFGVRPDVTKLSSSLVYTSSQILPGSFVSSGVGFQTVNNDSFSSKASSVYTGLSSVSFDFPYGGSSVSDSHFSFRPPELPSYLIGKPIFFEMSYYLALTGFDVPKDPTGRDYLQYSLMLHAPDGSIYSSSVNPYFVNASSPGTSSVAGLQTTTFRYIGSDNVFNKFYVSFRFVGAQQVSNLRFYYDDLIHFSDPSKASLQFYIQTSSHFFVDSSYVPDIGSQLIIDQLEQLQDDLGGKLQSIDDTLTNVNDVVSGLSDDFVEFKDAFFEEHSPLPSLPSVPSQLTSTVPPLPYDVGDFQSDFTDMFNQTLAVRNVMSDFIIWLFTDNSYIGFFETCLLIVGITILVYRMLNRGGALFKGS